MVNVILDAKNQSFKLCSVDGIDVVSYHSVKKVENTENPPTQTDDDEYEMNVD